MLDKLGDDVLIRESILELVPERWSSCRFVTRAKGTGLIFGVREDGCQDQKEDPGINRSRIKLTPKATYYNFRQNPRNNLLSTIQDCINRTKSSWQQLFSLPFLTPLGRNWQVRNASQDMGVKLISDTFDSYVLIPVIYVRLVLIVCALVLVRQPRPRMMWFKLMLAHRQSPPPMKVRDSCLVTAYSQHVATH